MPVSASSAPSKPSDEKLYSLQYLRFFAALFVVFHHTRNPGLWTFNPLVTFTTGAAGVDIFFVLTGFLMFVIGRNETPGAFCAKRTIRIIPMYWLATGIRAAWMAAGIGFLSTSLLPEYLTKSLLFIPFQNIYDHDAVHPLVVPGWTLNYEMFFYAVFAISLLFKRIWLINLTIFLGLFALGLLLPTNNLFLKFYTDPIILEFLAGLGLGALYTAAGNSLWFKSLIILFPLGIAWFFLPLTEYPEIIRWGGGAILIVTGLLASERCFTMPYSRTLATLGDASYCIYLFHSLGLAVLAKLMAKVLGDNAIGFYTFIPIALVCSVSVGVVLHLFVEKPTVRWLRNKLIPRNKAKVYS